MKPYLVQYTDNYGLGVCVVNADTPEAAIALATRAGPAWDNATATEIDTKTPGLVLHAETAS